MKVLPIILPSDNVFIVEGKILFDTGTYFDRKYILENFEKNKINLSEINLIVISHSHHHNAANADYFRELTEAPILIHEMESDNLKKGIPHLNRIDNCAGFIASFANREKPFTPVNPDIEYTDEFDLSQFGVDGKVVHTPGHTRGSSSIFLSDRRVLCGEVIIKKICSCNPSFPYFIENKEQLFQSYTKIMNFYPKIIYSSHGGPFYLDNINYIIQKNIR